MKLNKLQTDKHFKSGKYDRKNINNADYLLNDTITQILVVLLGRQGFRHLYNIGAAARNRID